MSSQSDEWLQNARNFQNELLSSAAQLHSVAEDVQKRTSYVDLRPATSTLVKLVNHHCMVEHTFYRNGIPRAYVMCNGCDSGESFQEFPCKVMQMVAKSLKISLEWLMFP